MALPPFQQLLDAHGQDVHRFLTSLVGRTDADDCYQETWLSALRAYPALRDAGNLRGWILTIAHHKAIDHLRAVKRAPTPTDPTPGEGAVAQWSPDAAAQLADEELWGRVRRLPAKQRAAVILRYLSDAPYQDISRLMGISEAAARRNVHEALKRLRLEYQP